MWISFSPDDHHIASVSWDGTMRMHSALTGALSWVTPNSGAQSWVGSFTQDSEHIMWSSNTGRTIQVHNAVDGRLVSTFQPDQKFTNWCRSASWHPDNQQLAMCAGSDVYVWRPFDGSDGGTITQHFRLPSNQWRSFASIKGVKWVKGGRKLALESSEETVLVWNSQSKS